MATSIMEKTLGQFNSDRNTQDVPHTINRYMGGNQRKNHPFISGYWYLVLEPPTSIFNDEAGVLNASHWFHSTAEGFTPPSKTITKVDVPGMGGMASSYAAGQEFTREFTCTFREYQNLPISTAIRTWSDMFDPHLGRSPLNDFRPDHYKGACYAILARPTLNANPNALEKLRNEDIEQVYYMEGVFPTTIPDDVFSADIATNDVAQLSVTFSFDGGFYTKSTPEVVDTAITKLEALRESSADKGDSYAVGLAGIAAGTTTPTA